ncbi:MAG TPA: hypothetical protein VF717_09025 [Pyrinomonadaceae bacterium]
MKKLSVIFALCLLLTACSKPEANTNTAGNTNTANANAANAAGKTATANPTPSIDPNYQATFPFKDFPLVETTAKAGEVVLVPSYLWLQQANVNGIDKTNMIWYSETMVTPGKEMSEVQFTNGDKKQVPNAYIVPIPAGQTARTGDLVLTWWQSGSGMMRAIVVDGANPSEPVVRYLDLDYDNPAKGRDGQTTIGQMDEKLKPNTFVKINNTFEPGTTVAVQDGARMKKFQVIREAGDKLFLRGFAGYVSVFDKSRCTPVPLKPAVKEGDSVKGDWAGTFQNGTVTKVDPKIGRVFIKFEVDGKERAVAFGDVMK